MKTCTKCNITKNDLEFSKSQNYCKLCVAINRDEYRHSKKGLIARIYSHQKESSKSRQYPLPSYTQNELEEWVYSQSNFDELYENWKQSNYQRDLRPSIDRINDYVSYTIDNIQLMTLKDNVDKSNNDRINGINNKMNKSVNQYSKENILINTFYSVAEASRQTNIQQVNISKCCRNERKTAGGFIWRYE